MRFIRKVNRRVFVEDVADEGICRSPPPGPIVVDVVEPLPVRSSKLIGWREVLEFSLRKVG